MMEQLLNLFWAMLVVLAALIWLRERRFVRNSRRLFCFTSSFVSLVCLLALLFPVVSATDDMQAMRGEVEESSPTKRVVKQSASLQSSTWANDGGPPAQLTQEVSFQSGLATNGRVSEYSPVLIEQPSASMVGCRAPPAF
jgi:hypothetical protein